MNSDRTPKPAYKTVEKMFSKDSTDRDEKVIPAIAISSLTLLALGARLWARKDIPAA